MKRTLSSDQPSILQCYMKEESSLDIPTSNPIEPPCKKDKKHSTAFAKLRDYDPFVLQKIFSYCHPVDMTNSLMMVCSEWNEWYFQKKHFQGFLKEWLLERWNHLIRDLSPSHQADDTANELVPVFLTKLKDETCCEIALLKYALRWLKLFLGAHPFGRKGEFGEEYKDHKSENEYQYEIEDEEDEDDEEDDEEEEEWISKQGPSNSRGCNLEIIFTNYSILYKLKWKDGFFTIFDNDGGNIVNIRKSGKRDVEANFFGGFYYPDLEKCVYRRTDYWMGFNNDDKRIFGRQLSHILSLWNIFDSYCNTMNLMKILEIEGTKLTRRNYIDYNWNSGEIKQLPWEVNYGITIGTSSLYSGDEYYDIPTIMDDRCFEDFSFFVATLRAHNAAMKYLLKVAPSHFTNNEVLIPFLKYSNSAFKYLHESLRHDKDKLLTMLKQNGNILKYLSSTEYENIITIDKDLVVFCVVHGCRLSNIPSLISFDKEMAISVIQQYDFVNQTHWDTLTCDILSYPWRNDLDVVCAMLKRDAFLSIFVCRQLLEDKNALLELVKYGPVLRDVSKSIQRAHPEIVVASIQTFYNFLQYANRQTDFIDITRESLEQLIQKKKNLCVKFAGRKIVTEIMEKRLQLIFLYSQQRKQHFHLKKIFGSSIEELGYDSEMIVYEFAAQEFGVHKTNDEVIQHYALPQLKKLANIDALLQDHTDSVLREVIIQATRSLNEK